MNKTFEKPNNLLEKADQFNTKTSGFFMKSRYFKKLLHNIQDLNAEIRWKLVLNQEICESYLKLNILLKEVQRYLEILKKYFIYYIDFSKIDFNSLFQCFKPMQMINKNTCNIPLLFKVEKDPDK